MNTDKLKELALAATPGPWVASNHGDYDGDDFWYVDTSTDKADYYIGNDNEVVANHFDDVRAEADIKFISEANPATILALIAQRDELLAALIEQEKLSQLGIVKAGSEFINKVRTMRQEAIAKAVQP